MKKMSETVVFFGNERLATGVQTDTPTLRALVSAGYHVASVVSANERATSRSNRDLEVRQEAEKHTIPVLLPQSVKDIRSQLAAHQPTIGVLVAYGKIIPQSILDLFPHGIINIHPSLLPKHRGSTPIESAILDGDTRTGVSVMKLTKTMDAGPVYAQSEVKLSGKETKQELADQLLDIGQTMILDLLPGILSGKVVALPQDDSLATYDERISKDDGQVDWQKPAERIEREVRAFAEWPKSRTRLAGKDVIITKSSVLPLEGRPGDVAVRDKKIVVFCAKDALVIEELKPDGRQKMTSQAFLAGHSL